MNKKLLIWFAAAALLTTGAACQNNAQPAPANLPIAADKPAPTAGNGSASNESTSQPTGQTQAPAAAKPAENGVFAPQPAAAGQQPPKAGETASETQQPAPAVQKLYKMNPKSYDIVPIDPAVTDKNVVLLTFDDGPKDKDMLEPLLNTLDKHHAKAIFFVNGYRVKQKPELIKLITDHGQTIGNHSWDHIDLKKESKEKIDQQIGDVQKIITELTGSAPKFFRPPFGSGGDLVREKVKQENMLFMTWSNGSLDWEMTVKNNNPDKVISNVMEQLRPGSNILMHELPWTVQSMDKMLTQLEEKKYGFADPAAIDTSL
jgi:peptidoglycan/xylan/chitin deacetylase (PgdA/CDA1 family)